MWNCASAEDMAIVREQVAASNQPEPELNETNGKTERVLVHFGLSKRSSGICVVDTVQGVVTISRQSLLGRPKIQHVQLSKIEGLRIKRWESHPPRYTAYLRVRGDKPIKLGDMKRADAMTALEQVRFALSSMER